MIKKLIIVAVMAVALSATAANRFYLPDFTISAGETMQVAMILENDEPFTAFQTDLILPQGLSVVQDDGEYLLDLTGRNASDQAIISKLRPDGALRMVSFCMSVKPYSGNNGALVVINFHADEDFIGPAAISLKNSFFANVDGVQFILPQETCTVQLLAQQIKGDTNGDGKMNISDVTTLINYLLAGCTTSFHTENADVNEDGNITISDVTSLINMLLRGD